MISLQQYNSSVKDFSRNLFRYLFKCLKDEELCNDIIQDAFLKLWQNREKVNPEKIKSWLFSTAHNLMINQIKKSSRTVGLQDLKGTESCGKDISRELDTKEIIDKVLQILPEIQKSIILLRDLEGYNYEEIGEILQLNESQVKVYLFRARQKLKEALKNLHFVL